MTRLSTLLLFIFLSIQLFPTHSKASHIAGHEATLECLNPCTVRVRTRMYVECFGTAVFHLPSWTSDSSTCALPTMVSGGPAPTYVAEIAPMCPSAPAGCHSPGAPRVLIELWESSVDYEVCGAGNCEFSYDWGACCRAANTSNPNAHISHHYIELLNWNRSLSNCNATPVWHFGVKHIPIETHTEINLGAWDPDGDSLVYSLISCRDSVGPIPYHPGYSPTSPLGPNWSLTLDSHTGIAEIAPAPGSVEKGILCIQIDEFRNGVQIGNYSRELTLESVAGTTNTRPEFNAPVVQTPGCWVVGDTIYTCNPGQVVVDFSGYDPDPGQTSMLLIKSLLTDSMVGVFATATINSNPIFNPVRGYYEGSVTGSPAVMRCFLNPPAPGFYPIRVEVRDDLCNIVSFRKRAFYLAVGQQGTQATASIQQCANVKFEAFACGGTGTFTYTWSGTGGLTLNPAANQPQLFHVYPGSGSYSWQCIISDGAAIQDTISGVVNVVNPPVYTPGIITGGQLVACSPGPVMLTGPTGYANYIWSNGMSGNAIAVSSPGIYHLTAIDTLGCVVTDTFSVTIDSAGLVDGWVTTSTGAPLSNQAVLAIRYDTIGGGTLTAIDTAFTDAAGYYSFCNLIADTVYLKALPSLLNYPNEMPTYADTAIFWMNAVGLPTATHFTRSWQTLSGTNPGGPGFIGGLISLGANKVSGVGDPVEGLMVSIREAGTRNYLGYAYTDAQGYFSFSNLPIGQYDIVVDKPWVSTVNVPSVPLTSSLAVRDSLQFFLHSTYLELIVTAGVSEPTSSEILVFPNPVGEFLQIQAPEAVHDVFIMDMHGRIVQEFHPAAKKITMEIGENRSLSEGAYFLRMRQSSGWVTRKVIVRSE